MNIHAVNVLMPMPIAATVQKLAVVRMVYSGRWSVSQTRFAIAVTPR